MKALEGADLSDAARFAMARHIDLRSNWERYTNKLAAVTEDVGRLLERALNYSPSLRDWMKNLYFK
jgi:hypothetical protein